MLICIGAALAILWMYCQILLPGEFAGHGVSGIEAERLAGLATLIVFFSVPTLPVYRLFPRRTVIAASSIGWVPLALALGLVGDLPSTIERSPRVGFAVFEGGACWAAFVLGAWTIKTVAARIAASG